MAGIAMGGYSSTQSIASHPSELLLVTHFCVQATIYFSTDCPAALDAHPVEMCPGRSAWAHFNWICIKGRSGCNSLVLLIFMPQGMASNYGVPSVSQVIFFALYINHTTDL